LKVNTFPQGGKMHISKFMIGKWLKKRRTSLIGMGRWLWRVFLVALIVLGLVCILKVANDNPREGLLSACLILAASGTVFTLLSIGKNIVRIWKPQNRQSDIPSSPRRSRKRRKIAIFLLPLGILLVSWVFYSWYFESLPQAVIHIIGELQMPATGERILVFTPHPDDETIGVGGYIAASIESGASVWVVLVTDGNNKGMELQRYQEFREAVNILGVPEENLFFLGYADGLLKNQDQNEIRARFVEIVLQIQPDIIIAPHPEDLHIDHKITGVLVASIAEETDITLYQYFIHDNHFPNPRGLVPDGYLLPSLRMIVIGQNWRRFMLSGEIMDVKQEAILQYRSQLRNSYLRNLLFGFVRQNELFLLPDD